jgi:hypothetical protein
VAEVRSKYQSGIVRGHGSNGMLFYYMLSNKVIRTEGEAKDAG